MSVCSSCRPFALNDLDDYEKHFTVMNYDPEVVLKQVRTWGAGSLWRLAQTGPHTHQRVFRASCVLVRGAALWDLRPLPALGPASPPSTALSAWRGTHTRVEIMGL